MRISDLLQFAAERGEPVFSFEFFPPRTDEGRAAFVDAVRRLRPLGPGFVSVTWGAGGSTRGRTLEMVTCCKREFVATEGGLRNASDLVELAREVAAKRNQRLCIGAACYPEGHPECRDLLQDLAHLKVKVDAGVDFLVTQLFFDTRTYLDFVGRARAAGIAVPILPGLMPVTNVEQIRRFTTLCGAAVPPMLSAALRVRSDDADATLQLGVAYASLQAAELLRAGAPGIHFYTLNKSPATRAIVAALRAAEPWRTAA